QHVVRPEALGHEQLVAVGRRVVLDVLHLPYRGVRQADLLQFPHKVTVAKTGSAPAAPVSTTSKDRTLPADTRSPRTCSTRSRGPCTARCATSTRIDCFAADLARRIAPSTSLAAASSRGSPLT